MPLVPAGSIVTEAARARRPVGAFNVVTLEQIEGVIAGAERVGASVILQISENAVRYHAGAVRPLAAACVAAARESTTDVGLHFDHVTDLDLAGKSAEAGFSSVMIDASKYDYEENVAITARMARELHDEGLWVEAELGEVGGKDGVHAPGVRTNPDDAAAFVAATGVDALAVAVGSSHAMRAQTATLDHGLITRLHEALSVPLVLHGSSGVPPESLQRAVAAGMTKINIGTLLGSSFTRALRDRLLADPDITDPRKALAPARDAVADTVDRCLRDMGVA
jgi:fructose-bisphosphate aldolase, class II